jgi:hypothetical protein
MCGGHNVDKLAAGTEKAGTDRPDSIEGVVNRKIHLDYVDAMSR